MAFPSIRSSSSGTAAGSSFTATMPASITAGDLLIAIVQINATATLDAVSGWTRRVSSSNRHYMDVKVAAGSDTYNPGLSAVNGVAYVIVSIQDWEGTLSGVEQDNVGTGDPNTLTPTWGSADTLWLVSTGGKAGTLPAVSAWSTNYTEEDQATGDFGTDCFAGVSYYANAASSDNPSVITYSGSPTNLTSITIGVEPGSGAQPVTPTLVTQSLTAVDPTVTTGAVTITPALVTQSLTAVDPALTTGAVTLTPSLVTQTLTPVDPTVTVAGGTQTLTPTLVTQTLTPVDPAITAVAYLTPTLVTQALTAVDPAVAVSTDILPALVTQTLTPITPQLAAASAYRSWPLKQFLAMLTPTPEPPRVACPYDGEPLERRQDGLLHCPAGNYTEYEDDLIR